jgi:predicted secreted hydrolase
MKTSIVIFCLVFFCDGFFGAKAELLNDQGWALAIPGYQIRLPQDHGPHYGFKTEWWYFTGNLKSADGREFGYQLTFFRFGMRPPAERKPATSRFVMNDLKFAHFTVTDVRAGAFHFDERLSRGGFGEAGFGSMGKLAWIENWELDYDGRFRLNASNKDYSIDLTLDAGKPAVLQGDNGLSQKGDGKGSASYCYSMTRLPTTGTIRIASEQFNVNGNSWYDREWATNQLAPNQVGWNWFAVQLSDGSDLMLYQMRLKDGTIDPHSNGTFVRPDGKTEKLVAEDLKMKATGFWKSPETESNYPISWRLEIPKISLSLEIVTPVKNQELNLGVVYWEGCIRVNGSRGTDEVNGVGYMELTGYRRTLPGLNGS